MAQLFGVLLLGCIGAILAYGLKQGRILVHGLDRHNPPLYLSFAEREESPVTYWIYVLSYIALGVLVVVKVMMAP